MEEYEKLVKLRNQFIQWQEKALLKLDQLREKLVQANEENDDVEIEKYEIKINDLIQRINYYKYHIEFMRPNNVEDLNERKQILKEFPNAIRNNIPDGIPIVFHGNKLIGAIQEIIKSGGLKTPTESKVSYSSFATQVDVTNKYETRVSCEFAEPGFSTFMPYGAIFAFYPLEEEVEKVLRKSGTEVENGVKGIDFKTESQRFIGVITTHENKDRIKKWFLENGLDPSKVFTHGEFIEMCKNIFASAEKLSEEKQR